jgi:hypothetical protein
MGYWELQNNYYSWEDWDQLEIYKSYVEEVMIVCKTSFIKIV